jgi:hypothetical protein
MYDTPLGSGSARRARVKPHLGCRDDKRVGFARAYRLPRESMSRSASHTGTTTIAPVKRMRPT